ncbi:MAG TPA: phytanoyl-CoA dioxygenase family protein [Caulobacteraceae bacterium]|nr:phytanoyl-CoA dioxygenase family protein [Caulobacteraceae bacterium]
MLDHAANFEMTPQERAALAGDGFVLREGVFDAAECAAIAADCEALVTDLAAASRGKKHALGSYMFEVEREAGTIIKWEPDAPDVVQGVEPFGHISKPLNDWGLDARFVDPAKAIVGEDDLVLFTEKLNVKRAKDGGHIILHQDFPYWEPTTPVASRIATAMLFIDDATVENGCLEVAPGSHTSGKYPQREADAFGSLEMDPAAFDHARLRPLEVKAGAVVWFGAFLVHRSLPNRSDKDRRALLYSYQPAGCPHIREISPIKRAAAG